MENIRDMPVCPKSREVNLYYIIQKNKRNKHGIGIYECRQYDGSDSKHV